MTVFVFAPFSSSQKHVCFLTGGMDVAMGMGRAMRAMALFAEAKQLYSAELEAAGSDEAKRAAALTSCHAQIAPKVVNLCRENGGIYIKAAQLVASISGGSGERLIPKEYKQALAVLCDAAPVRPFSDVDAVIREELGGGEKGAHDIFDDFSETPIAAASLAQVHVAEIKGKPGSAVAVKVQHYGLREQMAADFGVLETMGSQVEPLGPAAGNLTWLVRDVRAAIERELDFEGEAKNADKTRQIVRTHICEVEGLDGDGGDDDDEEPGDNKTATPASERPMPKNSVYVPKVRWSHTRKRVLTLDFARDAFRVTDVTLLKHQSMDPLYAGRLVSTLFSELMLTHGWVHGDPHPGNVYVRRDPRSYATQLVVLDHGLYHALSDDVRTRICLLCRASCVAATAGGGAAAKAREEVRKLSASFVGDAMARFFPMLVSPWFALSGDCTVADALAAARGDLPPGVSKEDVGRFLTGLRKDQAQADATSTSPTATATSDHLLGVFHSMGYVRGLLNDLTYPEGRRLDALVSASLRGLDESTSLSAEVVEAKARSLSRGFGMHVAILSFLAAYLKSSVPFYLAYARTSTAMRVLVVVAVLLPFVLAYRTVYQ